VVAQASSQPNKREKGAKDSAAAPSAPPSRLKTFTYGALGVDRPKGLPAVQEEDYTAGQWASAALKVAGIVALLA
jgi:hypothetical protein